MLRTLTSANFIFRHFAELLKLNLSSFHTKITVYINKAPQKLSKPDDDPGTMSNFFGMPWDAFASRALNLILWFFRDDIIWDFATLAKTTLRSLKCSSSECDSCLRPILAVYIMVFVLDNNPKIISYRKWSKYRKRIVHGLITYANKFLFKPKKWEFQKLILELLPNWESQ